MKNKKEIQIYMKDYVLELEGFYSGASNILQANPILYAIRYKLREMSSIREKNCLFISQI